MCPFNEHKNLHFKDEQQIHMSFKNYEENGYRHDPSKLSSPTNCVFHILREVDAE